MSMNFSDSLKAGLVTANSYAQHVVGGKWCKPEREQGCGKYKDISEFSWEPPRVATGKKGRFSSWCAECASERDARKCRNFREKRKHGSYKYGKNGDRYNVMLESTVIRTVLTEQEAIDLVKEFRGALAWSNLFLQAPAPPLIYDVDTDRMVPRWA